MIREIKYRFAYSIVGYFICVIYGLLERNWLVLGFEETFIGIEGVYHKGIADYFEVTIRLTLVVSICATIPFVLIEGIFFIMSGLRRIEQLRLIRRLMLIYFCYGSLLIVGLGILVLRVETFLIEFKGSTPVGAMSFYREYYLWIEKVALVMILVSQLPLLWVLIGFSPTNRKYLHTLIVVLSGILTPPEVWSQLVVVIPAILLWEGIVFSDTWYKLNL